MLKLFLTHYINALAEFEDMPKTGILKTGILKVGNFKGRGPKSLQAKHAYKLPYPKTVKHSGKALGHTLRYTAG